MKKFLLTLCAVAALGLAGYGPGGGGATSSSGPPITRPLTTGAPGSSLPGSSPDMSGESPDMGSESPEGTDGP